MRATFRRYLVVCLILALSATAGASASYLLVRHFILKHALGRVVDVSAAGAAELGSSIRESRQVLRAMNASLVPICSAADLDQMRIFIFHAQYLKEAGRVRDGRVICSTTYGVLHEAVATPEPDAWQRDGAELYLNLPRLRVAGRDTITVQQDSAFVVYNPFSTSELAGSHMHFTVTTQNRDDRHAGLRMGEQASTGAIPVNRDGDGFLDGQIFATRCTQPGATCVTVFTPVDEVIDGSFPVLVVLGGLGALGGALFGVVCAQLYVRKRSMSAQLHRAIADERLFVVYQPIVDLKSGRIVEAEALVRWSNDQEVAVSPDVFVPVAEQGGFVGEITRLVVRRVLAELGQMLRENPGFRVSVNVAAQDLADPKFLPMLERTLEQFRVRPESVGIEITESFTVRQQVAKDTIAQLRERGHYVSIDDFGTGYSSLAYLHDLAVDAIKIDKAFTRAIGTDAVTVSILPQILSMAERLRLHVTVEGIETMDQARYFASAPVPIRAQGWLYGHPAPWDLFLFRMETGPALPVKPDTQVGPVPISTAAR